MDRLKAMQIIVELKNRLSFEVFVNRWSFCATFSYCFHSKTLSNLFAGTAHSAQPSDSRSNAVG